MVLSEARVYAVAPIASCPTIRHGALQAIQIPKIMPVLTDCLLGFYHLSR